MTQFILGVLAGLGAVFTYAAIMEVDERKKQAQLEKFEEWRRKLP